MTTSESSPRLTTLDRAVLCALRKVGAPMTLDEIAEAVESRDAVNLQSWLSKPHLRQLLRPVQVDGQPGYTLTANGSWFVDAMIEEPCPLLDGHAMGRLARDVARGVA